MGKGDKKTARGKIWRGSYGNSRPHSAAQTNPRIPLPPGRKKAR